MPSRILPALTGASCVLLATGRTLTATLHLEDDALVVHLIEPAGLTRHAWPQTVVLDAMLEPGVTQVVPDVAVHVDETTGDVLVTLDGADGDDVLAVPAGAVRSALTH